MPSRTNELLADLVDLAVLLERDDVLAPADRARHDITTGATAEELAPVEQLRAWVRRHREDDRRSEGARLVRGRASLGVTLAIAGLVLGWALAAAIFHYDGSRPVNAVNVLAVLVVAQLLLTGLSLVLILPPGLGRRIPGLGAVQRFLGALGPGRIALALRRMLPAVHRDALGDLMGDGSRFRRRFEGAARWVVFHWSQSFALAFQVGALASAASLVLLSDLAFGWSTTLDVGAEAFHRFTGTVGAPWSAWLPAAVPSLELVEGTRYFRLSAEIAPRPTPEGVGAETLGRWWAFLLAAMVCYGLVPRIVTRALAEVRLRHGLRRALLAQPGATELLERLRAPAVETRGTDAPAPTTEQEDVATADPPTARGAALVDWGDSGLDDRDAATLLGGAPGARAMAGGGRSTAEDRDVIARLAETEGVSVVVAVRSWEAPLLDLADFIAELRESLGPSRPVLVFPVSATREPPDDASLAVWRGFVRRLGDPGVALVSLPAAPR